jgi:hypothetical protein
MWIFTSEGFYSVVQKAGESILTVRARRQEDLERLQKYLPRLSTIYSERGSDYAYRANCTHEEWALALARMALTIDYSNFKSTVLENARHEAYMRVWSAMSGFQRRGELDFASWEIQRECSVEGCANRHYSYGKCRKHREQEIKSHREQEIKS